MTSLQERLQYFIASKDKSVLSFENQCGIAPGTVSKMSEKSRLRTFEKIAKANPDLNMNWLKTGEGEMLNPAPQEQFEVGVGIGKQQGGKNDFNIEIKESDNAKRIQEDERKNCAVEIEIEHLMERLKEKDATIAALQASVARLEKMNDFLMNGK